MKRKIIKIDQNKCNGCGLCVSACHEQAIGIVNGKARLLRDDYCDGLGDCLPACPVNAISFEEREAAAYNEEAVKANIAAKQQGAAPLPCGCPGTHSKKIERSNTASHKEDEEKLKSCAIAESKLSQWPVQIKLVPINAPYFNNANLLIAADCTAYAYGDFHNRFIKNRITLIGCPKLDATEYSSKLTEIIKSNDIKSITVVKMEVPCCGGLEEAVKRAIVQSGKMLPWQIYTITTDGRIIE